MGCGCGDDLLALASDATARVQAGGAVPLGTVVARRGCGAQQVANGVVIAPGTWLVRAVVSVEPVAQAEAASDGAAHAAVLADDAANDVSLFLELGGQAVQGATATGTGACTLPLLAVVTVPRGGTLTMESSAEVDSRAVSVVVARA